MTTREAKKTVVDFLNDKKSLVNCQLGAYTLQLTFLYEQKAAIENAIRDIQRKTCEATREVGKIADALAEVQENAPIVSVDTALEAMHAIMDSQEEKRLLEIEKNLD